MDKILIWGTFLINISGKKQNLSNNFFPRMVISEENFNDTSATTNSINWEKTMETSETICNWTIVKSITLIFKTGYTFPFKIFIG